MQKKKLPNGSFFSYSNHDGLAEQECLTVLDYDTAIGLIQWTTKHIVHRRIKVESSLRRDKVTIFLEIMQTRWSKHVAEHKKSARPRSSTFLRILVN